jgi:spermidine synthase
MSARNESHLVLLIASGGLTSLLTQIVVLREFLVVFSGNELIIGIILSSWMILTGAGSLLGRYLSKPDRFAPVVIAGLLLLSVFPILSVLALNHYRAQVLLPGVLVDPAQAFAVSFLLLLPFCMVSGALFTVFSSCYSRLKKANRIGSTYGIEAAGSMVGGLAGNLILLYFDNYFALQVLMSINLALAMLTAYRHRSRNMLIVSAGFALLACAAVFGTDLYKRQKEKIFKGQEVMLMQDTPYGHLDVTKSMEQLNFYQDGIPLFSTGDVTAAEENVHYAMLQRKDPRNVLMISGGLSGGLEEVLKYGVDTIVYLELNRRLIAIAGEYLGIPDDPRLHIVNRDAILYLKKCTTLFDVVLINLPEPSTASINRYYTAEFFGLVKSRMRAGGVLSTGLLPASNYVSDVTGKIYAVLFNTLHQSFGHVVVIPGGRNFFLASGRALDMNIASLAGEKMPGNLYVNPYYLDDVQLRERSGMIMDAMGRATEINRNFKPVMYYMQIQHWLSRFGTSTVNICIGLSLFLVLFLLFFNAPRTALFLGGFSSASAEFILLISFQALYGYIYQLMGILIAVFMGGLAVGTWMAPGKGRSTGRKHILLLVLGITLYVLMLPMVLQGLQEISGKSFVVHVVFVALLLGISILTGMLFTLASRRQRGSIPSVASGSYAADLAGSALGSLLVSVILFPLLGLGLTCGCIAIMNLAGCALILYKKAPVPPG